MSEPTPSISTPTPPVSPSTGVESPQGGGFFSKTGDAIGSAFEKGAGLVKSIFGDDPTKYNPKKIYSFVLTKASEAGSGRIGNFVEIPLILGPNGYSESYVHRTFVKPTLGGSAIIDFGIGNNKIKLQGEWYIPYLSKIPDPQKTTDDSILGTLKENIEGAKVLDNLKDNLGGFGQQTEYRSGIEEFFLIQYLLFHSHGYGGGFGSLFDVSEIDNFLGQTRFNYRDFALFFRDYDRARYVEVALTDEMMTVNRSTKDTNTLSWTIHLTVIGEKSASSGALLSNSGGQFNFNNIAFALSQLFADLKSLIEFPFRLQGALLSIARRVADFVRNTRELVDYAGVGLFKNLNDQGKLFNATWDDIRESVGGKKKGSLSEQLNSSVANFDNNFAKFQSQLLGLITEAEAILAIAGSLTVGNSGNSVEEELTIPGGSFVDLINTELYGTITNVLWIFEEIQANLIKASVDTAYAIYQLDASENLYIVADKLYGDSGLAVALASYNNIRATELPKGSVIRTSFGNETGIIKPIPNNPDPIDLEESLIGGDIRLEENRDFAVAVNGDLGLVIGDETLINNILDLIDVQEGSIPFFPNLGNPLKIGEIYSNEEIQVAANRLLGQIQDDERVKSVKIKSIFQDGDTVAFGYDIQSRTGKSFVIQY